MSGYAAVTLSCRRPHSNELIMGTSRLVSHGGSGQPAGQTSVQSAQFHSSEVPSSVLSFLLKGALFPFQVGLRRVAQARPFGQ